MSRYQAPWWVSLALASWGSWQPVRGMIIVWSNRVSVLTGAVALGSLGIMAAAPLSAGATVQPPKVCGTETPDALFTSESAQLGRAHACEHLHGRHEHPKAAADARTAVTTATVAAATTTDPTVVGTWSTAVNPGTKTLAITSVMLNTGKVLMFGGKYKSTDKNTAAYVFDPVTKTGHEVPAPAAVYCSGVTVLSDGRILTVGGASPVPKGIVDVYLFDPVSEQWIRQPDSPLGRYYPSVVKLSDGRVVVVAGNELDGTTPNPNVELYTPPAAGGTVGTMAVVGTAAPSTFYPRLWVLPDGTVLNVTGRAVSALNTATWAWTPQPSMTTARFNGPAGIMLPGGPAGSSRVLMTGGEINKTALASTETFDAATPTVPWKPAATMPTTRAHMNLVQVPDGSAYGIGGNSYDLYDQGQPSTLHYEPATNTWTTLASQTPRRAYHSTAVLLPDGRIMSAGDSGAGGGGSAIDFYSPPYLSKGPRPAIVTAPSQAEYGSTFAITTSGAVPTRAVLMAPGATTHADEMHARHVELAVTPTVDGLSVTMPGSTIAPPGYYMLFVLTPDGIPSVASWVHVGPLN